MKVGAQKECRQTTVSPIGKGILYPKVYCKKLSNQKHTANTVLTTRGTTWCWMRGEIKELLFIKVTVYLPFSFRKNLNNAKYSIYGNLLYQFLALKVPVVRRKKPPTPVLQPSVFQLPLYLVIYSTLLELPPYSHKQLVIGDNEKNKGMFTRRCGSPGRWGNPPVHIICDHVYNLITFIW